MTTLLLRTLAGIETNEKGIAMPSLPSGLAPRPPCAAADAVLSATVKPSTQTGPMVAMHSSSAYSVPPASRVLRMPEVENRVGLKRSTLYDRIAKGAFPRSVPLGPPGSRHSAVGWLESELIAWLAQRCAERDAKKGGQA